MSIEENKAIARRWNEEVINKKNMALLDELVDAKCVSHTTQGDFNGPEGFKQFFAIYFAAFPDINQTIEDEIAEGDKVVHRGTVRGTHQGDLMGIPPTGKQINIQQIAISRIVGGKLVEAWAIADLLGMMQQLGVIPSQQTVVFYQ